ncbi:hypothetical protein EJ05DRAFT_368728 [Pseudovirgaria hyperparasitica]|uniref:Uncharacterized protein n=1 Tax=Pseudovirgaria hyperparasitica TaxID=470096 RepID=A0A6A6W5N3_9PEZI|nr:uncharacterized protein EJ05DRAFT_368728 [Pseudovirgaria hyperparasitica]KAF2757855.1 hypothetical protein EJ05DRAFT_368728 [Pseudovirgaria hyperparasitica]
MAAMSRESNNNDWKAGGCSHTFHYYLDLYALVYIRQPASISLSQAVIKYFVSRMFSDNSCNGKQTRRPRVSQTQSYTSTTRSATRPKYRNASRLQSRSISDLLHDVETYCIICQDEGCRRISLLSQKLNSRGLTEGSMIVPRPTTMPPPPGSNQSYNSFYNLVNYLSSVSISSNPYSNPSHIPP